jgi:hypothetical protein
MPGAEDDLLLSDDDPQELDMSYEQERLENIAYVCLSPSSPYHSLLPLPRSNYLTLVPQK